MFQRIGAELARGLVGGIGEHQLAGDTSHPAILPGREIGAGPLQHRLGPAHIFDLLSRGFHPRQRIEIGRIGVVPAEIELIDRLGIVAQRAVIAARRPFAGQARRQFQLLRDLGRG